MPLIADGLYMRCDDRANEVETNHYLKFYIKSALISLRMLTNYNSMDDSVFESKAQYYHFYTDHLLYSIGQISERFRLKAKPLENEKEYYERRKINRNNYKFSDEEYPILSNKLFRNTVEHIDEYNINVIENNIGVGGFNYIDESIHEELVNILLSERKNHIYTLNLLKMELYITRDKKELTLDLMALKNEIDNLMEKVDSFASFLEN